jgi:ClpP class serine protease
MNSHKLLRLTNNLHNTPHLISQDSFDGILHYLSGRNTSLSMDFPSQTRVEKVPSFDTTTGVCCIPLRGALTYRESGIEAMCGMSSYEGVLTQAKDALEAGIQIIILEVDSGGGTAQGCFDSAVELRQLCDEYGAILLTYCDGSMCSAAYAFGCVADMVVASKYAEIGSIGVLISLVDNSEQLKEEGVKNIYITDGSSKVPFDAEGKFKQEFLDEMQVKATRLGDAFRLHVTTYTDIPTDWLRSTQAKVFSADDALLMGLINSIMTKTQFINYVTSIIKGAKSA